MNSTWQQTFQRDSGPPKTPLLSLIGARMPGQRYMSQPSICTEDPRRFSSFFHMFAFFPSLSHFYAPSGNISVLFVPVRNSCRAQGWNFLCSLWRGKFSVAHISAVPSLLDRRRLPMIFGVSPASLNTSPCNVQ